MLQPAGVRTLLHMRSSAPLRPPTGRARRLRTADPSALRRTGTISPIGCQKEDRPLTAPAISGAAGDAIGIAFLGQTEPVEEEEDEENDDEDWRDPEELIAKASTDIYQLQHSWLQERQAEVGRLWEQLEKEYGFALPVNDPARRLEDIRSFDTVEPAAAVSLPSEGIDDSVAEDRDVEASVENIVGIAKSDLEAAQQFRQHIEQRRCQSADASQSATRGATSSAAAASAAMEDGERIGELRREVQMLRGRAQHAWCEKESHVAEALHAEGMPDETLGALNQWADNLRLLGAISAGGARSSLDLPDRGYDIVSSQLRVGGAGAPDESLAVQALSPDAQVGQQDQLESEIESHDSVAHTDSQETPDRLSYPDGNGDPSAMEQELDRLLGELDEFDRIHGDLCKLTCS